ncbi:hypothetical protein Acr_06g0009380 [Actinidia rufa]|uniref:GDSL-like Lipase/Acylhydrolase superfamily protein n=1 Tax=Actinidia rufa TaxID=165716 RepID=A0A7J0ER78_9ERIC|nr:hypothetical protein Acr_06g0009380 [Actinidia rufa]
MRGTTYMDGEQHTASKVVGRGSVRFCIADGRSVMLTERLPSLSFPMTKPSSRMPPAVAPMKNTDAYFRHGANFAVAGATALPVEVLAGKNISTMVTSSLLSVQLDWMFNHFNAICNTDRGCIEQLKNALFMVGGNDYNYALFQGKTTKKVESLVPDVVRAIKEAVRRVIHYGAVRVVVPGNFPIGCMKIYLTAFQTNDSASYDQHHCLKQLNNFSVYHNNQLQAAIEKLKREYPNVVIVYGYYYRTFQWLFNRAPYLACCGIGGDYAFSIARMCGAPGVPVCSNPNKLISWDGVHLIQEAYKIMTGWLIHDILPKLQCSF